MGIRINAKLYEMKSKSEPEINNAIDAVEGYINTDKKVNSKAGLFRKALEEDWVPNQTDEERKISEVNNNFSEWFDLAKKQGLVRASQVTQNGILVLDNTDHWISLATMLDKGFTLEYLKSKL